MQALFIDRRHWTNMITPIFQFRLSCKHLLRRLRLRKERESRGCRVASKPKH